MKPFVICFMLVSSVSCAQPSSQPVVTAAEFRTLESSKNVELGDRLARSGHFLEASFYYEAALFFSDNELRILPKLIAAQVKSDRLRAARGNLGRLIELNGTSPELHRLVVLLDTYAPRIDNEPFNREGAP